MILRFEAQYLNSSGLQVAGHYVFAPNLKRAYELAIERAQHPIDPISASWVAIKEDRRMFGIVPIPPMEPDTKDNPKGVHLPPP